MNATIAKLQSDDSLPHSEGLRDQLRVHGHNVINVYTHTYTIDVMYMYEASIILVSVIGLAAGKTVRAAGWV